MGLRFDRADLPRDNRLFVYVNRSAVKYVCQHVFRELDARYVASIGADDRPFSGKFLVAHNFAFDHDHLLCSVLSYLPADDARIDSISDVVPAANWAEREMRDLVGIEPVGHRYPEAAGAAGWLARGRASSAQGCALESCPEGYDDEREFKFDEPPEGCTVVPFGPFHPTLDEPAHFRLYVEGEMVRGCEYRGFMVHRGIEKLAESVLSYNDIPDAGRAHLRHLRLRPQRGVRAGRGERRRAQAAAAGGIHPHHHAGNRAPAQPSAVGRAGLPHCRLRHAVHAELPHPRTDHVDGGENQRQPQNLRARASSAACAGTSRRN